MDYCRRKFLDDYQIVLDNPDLRELLQKCFQHNYVKRPSAYVLREDWFFKNTGSSDDY